MDNNIEKILRQIEEREEQKNEERKDIEDELQLLKDSFDQWILVE